ncbi:uncharacterized protein LOC118080140 [Zootoca vivipara]|uniref:uncharacterized protein LOC118080140 n=1 Tax=Zootoca vivipara TaxID=8524 RepID=UPI00293BBE81|nr:uncharacterized protein LOC118080140 [Zootoca vivipara]
MALVHDTTYNSSIKEHLEAGMQELALLAGLLLLPWSNKEEMCAKTRGHVTKGSNHFSEAEQSLESRLRLLDSQSEALIAMKKLMQDDLQEKKEDLADLGTQIVALKETEKKSQEMLETAGLHLEHTEEQLRLAREGVARNRAGREIGLQMMALPGLGSFIGRSSPEPASLEPEVVPSRYQNISPQPIPSIPLDEILTDLSILLGASMAIGYQAALDSAEKLVIEAQQAVDLCTAEVAGCRDKIACLSRKQQKVQTGINSANQRIPQIEAQCGELLALQREVTVQQSWIRSCLSLLDLLVGKIHTAEVMSSYACVPEFLVGVLEEIAAVVGGKDGAAFHGDKELQASVLEINKAVNSLRARAGKNVSIDD